MGNLRLTDVRDSEEMAASRKSELDIDRSFARALGQTAVEASFRGKYEYNGEDVDWGTAVENAVKLKRSLPPDYAVHVDHPAVIDETAVEVANETTLGAAYRLVDSRPMALNFANGIHPGGGFLNGARAQEEFLCRSSALYRTLVGDPMYEAHRARLVPDSTAWVIHSPDVPIFRSDGRSEIAQPWTLSFFTCAAPVATRIGQPTSRLLLRERIDRILGLAAGLGYKTLILGAWGCGAFGNDPMTTAMDFRDALAEKYDGRFSRVVFAVTDWSPERRMLKPFVDAFR